MASLTSTDGLRDETVVAKTGKTRAEWHAVLDAFDCRAQGHKASAAHLQEAHGVGPWWAQSLTVDYERARGIREVGQRHGGNFAVDVSRTVACSVEEAWEAWADPEKMSAWFAHDTRQEFREGGTYVNADGDKGTFTRIVLPKRLHFTWESERHFAGSRVVVEFLPRERGKTTVVVTHDRLAGQEAREDAKKFWGMRLDSLKSFIGTAKSA